MRYGEKIGPDAEPGSESRRRKLRRLAGMAEWVALVGIALVVAYEFYLCINPDALVAHLQRDVPRAAIAPSSGTIALSWLLDLVPAAIFVAAMWSARTLFRRLGRAQILDPDIPPLLTRLGYLAIAAAGAGIVVRTVIGLTMTSGAPSGQRQLIIGISSGEITSLIVALLLFAFAVVMQEALRIEEDNRSIL